LKQEAVGRFVRHKTTTKTRKVLTEIQNCGYDLFFDEVDAEDDMEMPKNSHDAARMARMRRKRNVPERFNLQTQTAKLIKEARKATFEIFSNEIECSIESFEP
jgi:hypothetical protein